MEICYGGSLVLMEAEAMSACPSLLLSIVVQVHAHLLLVANKYANPIFVNIQAKWG